MNPEQQKQLAEKIADAILFIGGIGKPGKLVYPAMSEDQLAGCYNRSELVRLILEQIVLFKTPA